MDKETIKAALRAHEQDLKSADMVRLHPHGSVVPSEVASKRANP